MGKMKELWAEQMELATQAAETEDKCVEGMLRAIAGLKNTIIGLQSNMTEFRQDNEAGAEAISHIIRGINSDIELLRELIRIYNKE